MKYRWPQSVVSPAEHPPPRPESGLRSWPPVTSSTSQSLAGGWCGDWGGCEQPPGLLASIFHPETTHVHRSGPGGTEGSRASPESGACLRQTRGVTEGLSWAAADKALPQGTPTWTCRAAPPLTVSDHRQGRQALQRQPCPVLRRRQGLLGPTETFPESGPTPRLPSQEWAYLLPGQWTIFDSAPRLAHRATRASLKVAFCQAGLCCGALPGWGRERGAHSVNPPYMQSGTGTAPGLSPAGWRLPHGSCPPHSGQHLQLKPNPGRSCRHDLETHCSRAQGPQGPKRVRRRVTRGPRGGLILSPSALKEARSRLVSQHQAVTQGELPSYR